MNRTDFISYLQHPEELTSESAVNLTGLIHNFPYFQTAHLLYAKNLYHQNSIHYNDQLKIAAAYSGDRKILYNLIHSKNKLTSIKEKPEPVISDQTVIVSDSFPEGKPFVEVMEDVKPIQSLETGLEKEIMSGIISSSIEIEVRDEINNLKKEESKLSKAAPKEIATIYTDRPHSFLDWLKITSKSTSEDQKKGIMERKTEQALIEKFIAEEPKISKPKTEFFSSVNLARKGVVEDDSAVSETLLKIYETQGHYLKAINGYQSLILKYPEKKLFFAARIKELKKKLTS